jgi:hypothetical protein
MEAEIQRFSADWDMLDHRYPEPYSPQGFAEHGARLNEELANLDKMPFEKFDQESKVDWLLLRNLTKRRLHQLDLSKEQLAEAEKLLPFADTIFSLDEGLRSGAPVDAKACAGQVDSIGVSAKGVLKQIDAGTKFSPIVGHRAMRILGGLRARLGDWFRETDGFDPQFSWWVRTPYHEADKALGDLSDAIKTKVVGVKSDDDETLIGDPIGASALNDELQSAMIPYSADEVLAIADREFAWCENEIKKASGEMGFGDDWKKALAKIQQDSVPPGQVRQSLRAMEDSAIKFVEDRKLVTIPPLGERTWMERMISPNAQKEWPFFFENGGDINIAYPAESMTETQKLSSLAGNNIHEQKATVFHELYPGHALQEYSMARYRPYRMLFDTPFWMEGWAVNWEMEMYDLGFIKTPEDRVGALFWRMHRCARIVFSINFHLGKMTADQCVQYLVDKVGHSKESATAEVRRSINGDYEPLYQAAYMLGALQFRALRKELIDSGKMTPLAFHDGVMQGNIMPIEMVRARLENLPLSRDWKTNWRF